MVKKHWIILGLIVLLAAVLRFWQLGQVPPGLDWDEVALGYNAYSIIHTGKDEYGEFLPVVLRSFDDYKPALYAYLIIPFIFIFDLTALAVRMPSAVCGVVTVIAVYFLMKELFKRIDIAAITALLLAISPWHIQFSRIAFETNVGLTCNILTVLFFIKGLTRKWLLLLVPLFSCAAIYVYQSEKVFTPLLVLAMIIIYRKQLFALPKKYLALVTLTGIIIIAPIVVYTFTNKDSFARAKGVSIFSQSSHVLDASTKRLAEDKERNDVIGMIFDNRRFVYGKMIIDNYISHLSPNWLFITGDIPRHHAPSMGLLYLWELPFILIGIYMLIFGKYDKKTKALLFSWFFIAPLPASITTGVPHAVRTLNFLPIYQVFAALGIITVPFLIFNLKYRKIFLPAFTVVTFAIVSINIFYYLNQYFVQQNYYYSQEWQYGYEDIVSSVKKIEHKYDKIIVTNQALLDQSYMFFLFYLKYDPATYQKENTEKSGGFKQKHDFGKFVFRPIEWDNEKRDMRTMYVGRPNDFPTPQNSYKDIYYLDGTVAARIITP